MTNRVDPLGSAVSVVIPTWNGRHLLEEFLPSVIAAAARHLTTTTAPVEIVVVDDGSTDGTAEWVTARSANSAVPIRLVRLAANSGFGAACNAGAAAAIHPRMLLLNNDLAIEVGAIQPLAAHMDLPSQLGPIFAVHCRMQDYTSGEDVGTGKIGGFSRGFLRVHRSYVVREPAARPLPSMFATGGGSMFDRARFLEIGGFDNIFAPFYFEDVELSYRAWKRGWVVAYEPRACARHRFSSTIGALGQSRIRVVSHRNRLLLHWIHLDVGPWLFSHVGWTVGLAVWSLISLRPSFARALIEALKSWPAVRIRRSRARAEAARDDRDVAAIFAAFECRDDVAAYDHSKELAEGTKKRPA